MFGELSLDGLAAFQPMFSGAAKKITKLPLVEHESWIGANQRVTFPLSVSVTRMISGGVLAILPRQTERIERALKRHPVYAALDRQVA